MSTVRLFDEDSYLIQFEACVLSCEPDGDLYKTVLNETAFFPEEGGQSCDKGTIQDIEVVNVQEKDGVIYHWIKEQLWEGDTVSCLVDWEKRFSDMQQHSGEHIVSGIIHDRFKYDNVGFHLGKDYVRMDFNGVITPEQLVQVETLANRATAANVEIQVMYPDQEELAELDYRSKKPIDGQIRIVRIPGYDICACCAPHVHRTGEIGMIKLVGMENYKGGVRVYMLCGSRALADFRDKEANVKQISVMLSAKPENVAAAVAKLKDENLTMKSEIDRLKTAILDEHLKAIDADAKHVCFFDAYLEKGNSRKVWNELCSHHEGVVGVFAGSDEDGYMFILGGRDVDAQAAGKAFGQQFGCKGGGSKEMFQGRVAAKQEDIQNYFKNL